LIQLKTNQGNQAKKPTRNAWWSLEVCHWFLTSPNGDVSVVWCFRKNGSSHFGSGSACNPLKTHWVCVKNQQNNQVLFLEQSKLGANFTISKMDHDYYILLSTNNKVGFHGRKEETPSFFPSTGRKRQSLKGFLQWPWQWYPLLKHGTWKASMYAWFSHENLHLYIKIFMGKILYE
jgi:hypothetical protein